MCRSILDFTIPLKLILHHSLGLGYMCYYMKYVLVLIHFYLFSDSPNKEIRSVELTSGRLAQLDLTSYSM